uniref:Uncharacterized protein n=1 Tax=Meloidogyne floridensis TaxID=298350 RepID=A0A915NHS9_9BILA
MSKLFVVFVIFTIVLIQVCDSGRRKGTPIRARMGDHTVQRKKQRKGNPSRARTGDLRDDVAQDPSNIKEHEETNVENPGGIDNAGPSTTDQQTPQKRVKFVSI